MQPGDFNSSYHQFPHTVPADPNPKPISYPPAPPPAASSYASAPPYSAINYGPTPELSSAYHHTHPPFPHNSDPLPSSMRPYPPVPVNHLPPQVTQYFPPTTPVSPHVPEAAGLYPSAQQPPAPTPAPYFPYDPSPQTTAPPLTPTLSTSYPNPNPNSSSSLYPSNFNNFGSSGTSLYDAIRKSDQGSGYLDENLGGFSGYGRSSSDLGSDSYVNRTNSGGSRDKYGAGMYEDEGYGDGTYSYQGKTEPYGARGTGSKSSTWSGMFDDYGRPISAPSLDREKSSSLRVVRAIPKAESQSDTKSGVQKFRVKLLAESGGQSTMDVLCQVGLDGIRMLDPNSSRTLRIYPLENVTRCEKFDSSTVAFWSKASVDFEARRIRLQSNSYTTNTLLDTITAATVQFKEMGGRFKPPEPSKAAEHITDKKKGLTDWVTRLKPTFSSYEEKDHWVPDEAASKCSACGTDFGVLVRRHHCRNCGDVFCDKCTHGRIALTAEENAQPVRVCDRCMAEVTRRLSSAKEAGRSAVVQSHEDLAKKLQDEMERNRRASSGSKSNGSGRRMKEVACPTCTVHLQVQVPSSGSETIECGVCQHSFLVSSH